MSEAPLVAHSLAEAYLYLMATSCGSCGKGLLRGSDAHRVDDRGEPATVRRWRIDVTCGACEAAETLTFHIQSDLTTDDPRDPAVINPTDEPSLILDVGQWIVLFRVIIEEASKETDKMRARRLGLEAAQCLEEAMKFYDEVDNDLPGPEAFYCDASRERFRKAPEQFSRRRLIELRSKLPSLSVMRSRLSARKKRSWWRWRR